MNEPAPESVLDERRVGSGPIGLRVAVPQASTSATAPLKRRASEAFEDASNDETKHKKPKETNEKLVGESEEGSRASVDGGALSDNLEEELQCGCCSAIVYRPVVVNPCQHFFCGSCLMLWIKNGGTSCPACRTVSSNVSFSRPLEKVVDTLLRHAPGKARSASERMQADAIYHPGVHIRIPSPRQASPEPSLSSVNGMYVRPCPNCIPGNQWGWRCPQPIVDPDVDPTNAWPIDEGSPPGHGVCGNCENILALQAPTTTRCDFCQVSFCGINVPIRCIAGPIQNAQPHGLTDLSDLIQCGEVYECFEGNTVEVDIMLDYLSAQGLTPKHIYREIIQHIQNQPRQFAPLIELELFMDVHSTSGGVDPDPSAPRSRICRVCAAEILLYGLRDWWVRERKKGFLERHVLARPDCPEGSQCPRQKLHAHAKEFNHIIAPPEPHPAVEPAPQSAPAREPNVRSAVDFPPLASAIPAPELEAAHGPRADAFAAAVAAAVEDDDLPLPPTPRIPFSVPPTELFANYRSAPSSQDFRDEVDALL
ncbi:hypothetical protein BD311DRAFT_758099 [Dichomitus squalens]|uniref:RING-type domain-containing protein n=1 Tax=Dichomitus squalens TaxID=114155 RepID=A0A4Q9MQU1_9APHY|nr:hypothetical protein BD311DRAFT_758099 [Dichomitus squalens]